MDDVGDEINRAGLAGEAPEGVVFEGGGEAEGIHGPGHLPAQGVIDAGLAVVDGVAGGIQARREVGGHEAAAEPGDTDAVGVGAGLGETAESVVEALADFAQGVDAVGQAAVEVVIEENRVAVGVGGADSTAGGVISMMDAVALPDRLDLGGGQAVGELGTALPREFGDDPSLEVVADLLGAGVGGGLP